jgi:mannose-6-phosphate isomerase-like protein (cupin superfamily)
MHRVAGTPCQATIYDVARFTFSRLSRLPATDEGGGLRRYRVLNAPGMAAGLEVGHVVLKPGAEVAVVADPPGRGSGAGGSGTLLFTLSGRGAVLLDGDRIELAANDILYIQPGCAYALRTIGTSDWVYVAVRGP